MRLCLFFLLFFSSAIANECSIVFCYLGSVPAYVKFALMQARLFNPEIPIYFLTSGLSSPPWEEIDKYRITWIPTENLHPSIMHNEFQRRYTTDLKNYPDRYHNERFFYIQELMETKNLKNVFQIECDVMLYADLSQSLPIFESSYSGMAAPFSIDYLGSVSFVYFKDISSINDFIDFFVEDLPNSDMWVMAHYYHKKRDLYLDFLPIIPEHYTKEYPLINRLQETTSMPEKYYNNIEKFQSVFDPDFLGGYFDNDNPSYGNRVIYDPHHMRFFWEGDEQKRQVPYMYYKGQRFRVNTLHAFLKDLKRFYSLNQSMPTPGR